MDIVRDRAVKMISNCVLIFVSNLSELDRGDLLL